MNIFIKMMLVSLIELDSLFYIMVSLESLSDISR
jgi:hypothetical protein